MKTKVKSALKAIPHPLALSLALAFPLWPGLANALPTIAASGSYADQAGYFFADTYKSGTFDQPDTTTAFNVGTYGPAASAYDTSTALRAASDGLGHFGAQSLNNKIYGSAAPMTSTVHLEFADSIMNNTASAQNVNFDIAISQLRIDVATGSLNDMSAHTNAASFSANVYVGGSNTPIWSSGYSWNGGVTAASGADLGMAAAYESTCGNEPTYGSPCTNIFRTGSFGINGYSTSIDLGSLGANQALSVRYEIDLTTETNTYGGVASISFNDPSSLSSGPASGSLAFAETQISPVPEPGTYLMMAAGLGMLAAARRRRRSC